jgi:two-component sensor histidine kinase
MDSYKVDTDLIQVNINIKDELLDMKSVIQCGLIISELVSNSLKFAFPGGRKGEIRIELFAVNKGDYVLVVMDNGIGLPQKIDIKNVDSMGFQIIKDLVSQLQGKIEVDRQRGTKFKIFFSLPGKAE